MLSIEMLLLGVALPSALGGTRLDFSFFSAVFLHSVVEEYESSIWQRMGATIKSFFVGLFVPGKREKPPKSWKHIRAKTQPGLSIDISGFRGAFNAIRQLAKTFRNRFLKPAMLASDSSHLFQSYVAFIHSLVAQWMIPHRDKFQITDTRIPSAKKLFYYELFVHRKQFIALGVVVEVLSS